VHYQSSQGRQGNDDTEKEGRDGHQKACPQKDQVPVLGKELVEEFPSKGFCVVSAKDELHHKEEEPQQEEIEGGHNQSWRESCDVLSQRTP